MPAALRARLTATALAIAALLVPSLAAADYSTETQFVSATNSARAQNGLRSYAVSGDLSSVARSWASYMAAHRTLEHNPSYTSQVCCWTKVGENVGVGSTVSSIQRAFMASAPHRANILSTAFTQVGIGTARGSDGRLYVDEVFRRPTGATAHTVRSTTRTASHPTAVVLRRPTAVRASRSAHRAPRIRVRRPTMSWAVRLALAQQVVAPMAYADPVAGAWSYVRVMQRLSGSPAR